MENERMSSTQIREIVMPDLEGAEEITIGAWSKKKGDYVDEGETLLEAGAGTGEITTNPGCHHTLSVAGYRSAEAVGLSAKMPARSRSSGGNPDIASMPAASLRLSWSDNVCSPMHVV